MKADYDLAFIHDIDDTAIRRKWIEQNRDRIWELLRSKDRRDMTFNQLADELWRQV